MPAKSGSRPAGRPVGSHGRVASAARAAGQVRIIGGDLRRSLVPVPDVPGLRPTPDRVRETLFNWLGQTLPGIAVLDAFAGTGALGLEALSRGAARVDWFEMHPQAFQSLQQTVALLSQRVGRPVEAKVSRGDVCAHLRQLQASGAGFRYDLALLDPPFQSDWLARILPLMGDCVHDGGCLYVEWHQSLSEDAQLLALVDAGGWQLERSAKAGGVFYHLLRKGVPGGGSGEAAAPDPV